MTQPTRCGDIGENPREIELEPIEIPIHTPLPAPVPVEPEKVPA
jgi:hypothetical protein